MTFFSCGFNKTYFHVNRFVGEVSDGHQQREEVDLLDSDVGIAEHAILILVWDWAANRVRLIG